MRHKLTTLLCLVPFGYLLTACTTQNKKEYTYTKGTFDAYTLISPFVLASIILAALAILLALFYFLKNKK